MSVEVGNPHNTHAAAVKKVIDGNLTMVGHIPRRISSTICSMFLRRGGKTLLSLLFLTNGLSYFNIDILFESHVATHVTVLTRAFK